MSDYLDPRIILKALNKQKQDSINSFIPPLEGFEKPSMTSAEMETLPYLREEAQRQQQKASWLTPLELMMDLLSRGQYLTANIGQDIIEKKSFGKVLEGAVKGITGQRKGDWKTTIFGGRDEGEEVEGKGLFNNKNVLGGEEGKIPVLGHIPGVKNVVGTWQDMIGTLGNIFLDPTTYFTFGGSKGATVANKASAKFAAKEVLKRSLLNKGNLDDLAKIARKGFDTGTFTRMADKSLDAANKYVKQFVSANDLARFNNRLYKETYKTMLKTPGTEFVNDFIRGATEGQAKYLQQATEALASKGQGWAKGQIDRLIKRNPGSSDYLRQLREFTLEGGAAGRIGKDELKEVYKGLLSYAADNKMVMDGVLGEAINRVGDYAREAARVMDPAWAKNFEKMGERKVADIFGLEIGKGVRKPNIIARTSESLKGMVSRSKIGDFGRAVMAKLDDGFVGKIKSALNIRNPYQEMLNLEKMESHYFRTNQASQMLSTAKGITDKMTDEEMALARNVIDYAKTHSITMSEILDNPKLFPGGDPKKIAELKPVFDGIKWFTDDMFLEESKWAKEGFQAAYDPMVNYLPHRSQMAGSKHMGRELGSFAPNYTKHQEMNLGLIAKQDAEVMKFFLGTDDATAKFITENLNWSSTNMNLREMLMYRAYAHSQAAANVDLIKRFQPFGIRPEYITQAQLKPGMERMGEIVAQNLRQVQTEIPALKGMYFDRDVADIIDRVIPITSSDKGLKAWSQIMGYVTSQFKGFATLSPGFTIGNFGSNTMTGFINYGIKYLDPFEYRKSFIMSAYGLWGEEALKKSKIMKLLGATENSVNKILAEKIGGQTRRYWVDKVLKNTGAISNVSMGFDLEDTITKMTKKTSFMKKANPLSPEFIAFEKSRGLNAIVESAGRVQGFSTDIKRMAGKGGEVTQAMQEGAVMNFKKYFFDYEDLSDFEKNVLKKVIPFYTWIRKNVVLQAQQMIERTGTMSAVFKVHKGMQAEGVDMEELPGYARDEAAIPIEKTPEGLLRTIFPRVPYKDINLLPFRFEMSPEGIPIPRAQPSDAYDNFLSMAHPLFKTVLSTAGAGWDPFKKQQLDYNAPAPRAFRILGNNPEVFAMIDSVFKAVGIEKGLGLQVDKNGKLVMDGQAAKVLEDNFLLLKRLDDMGDTVATVFPQIDDEIEKLTGIKAKYDDMNRTLKTMSFALGISQRDIDMDKQNEYDFREALRKAEDAKREARNRTPGMQTRSQNYYKSYQQRMRRMRAASGYR